MAESTFSVNTQCCINMFGLSFQRLSDTHISFEEMQNSERRIGDGSATDLIIFKEVQASEMEESS